MGKTPSSHIIHSLGGEYCWIARDSEPIRLLKSPRSLSVYILMVCNSVVGTAGDSLDIHRNMNFSTKDQKNNNHKNDCASTFEGAWWYSNIHCHHSNLNGRYLKGNHSSLGNGVNWRDWKAKGFHYSLKRAEMKTKPLWNSKLKVLSNFWNCLYFLCQC